MNTKPDPAGDIGLPSKSQRKRDAHAVLELAKTITEMSDRQFQNLRLPEAIRDAARIGRAISAHGGRKRQIQYLAKLMREANLDDLYNQLRAVEAHAETSRRHHQTLEHWRDRLIAEGDPALTELLVKWPQADRQQLRQLARNARREQDRERTPAAARALFQYLKSL